MRKARPQLFKSWIALSTGDMSGKPINCAIQWIVIYPVDSVIHLLNDWGQMNKIAMPSPTRLGFEQWVNVSFP